MSDWLLHGEDRAAYIRGLRDLADWLEVHPAVPVDRYGQEITHCAHGTDAEERAAVDRFAMIADVTPVQRGGHYMASKTFGPFLAYRAVAITAREMDDYHVIQRLGRAALEVMQSPVPEPSRHHGDALVVLERQAETGRARGWQVDA